MIMRKPAHKDVDNPAGQVSNIDTYGLFAKAQYEHDIKPEYFNPPKKLGDIIDRVNKQEGIKQYRYKDFDEYMHKHDLPRGNSAVYSSENVRQAFNAAREMK